MHISALTNDVRSKGMIKVMKIFNFMSSPAMFLHFFFDRMFLHLNHTNLCALSLVRTRHHFISIPE